MKKGIPLIGLYEVICLNHGQIARIVLLLRTRTRFQECVRHVNMNIFCSSGIIVKLGRHSVCCIVHAFKHWSLSMAMFHI